jgi:hypothetical protein
MCPGKTLNTCISLGEETSMTSRAMIHPRFFYRLCRKARPCHCRSNTPVGSLKLNRDYILNDYPHLFIPHILRNNHFSNNPIIKKPGVIPVNQTCPGALPSPSPHLNFPLSF